MEEQFYTIILRHDTSTKWLVNDPILSLGEYGVEDDTHKVKRGDGESKWSELRYEDFGLQYIVTFANLSGELKDNEVLTQEFDKKVSKRIFNDVNNSVVAAIDITNDSNENIGKITKLVKEIELGGTTMSNLIVLSDDKSIQGIWSIDDGGARVLNLAAKSTINDYTPGKTYHRDYVCYYQNKLYRAVETFTAEDVFVETHWALLSSLHSNDIKYDNLLSGLDAENVKDALDELKRRDDRKVTKSTEERVVYGTTLHGEQTVIPIDDLRKVDTVNHRQADINKNVQIDASQINYTDADPSVGTVRQVLDSKVDKTVAGSGAKIVRDVRFNYNETTGHITLQEDKVSLEDGTSELEEREIDVVSEQELAGEVATLNGRIDTEVQTLNDRIDDEVQTLNTTITTKETAIYDRIQDEHDEINARVDTEVSDLNDRIDTEVQTLNTNINTKEQALQDQIDDNVTEIARVDTDSQARDTQLDTDINARIDIEVQTLNTNIDTKEQTINDRIDDEVSDLNDRIDDEVATLNTTINTKDTAMDNKKIDKDISTLIVTDVKAATHSQEPTINITKKNTTTKEAIESYLHFKANGRIRTTFLDADHIQIDSTDIDTIDNEQNRRLGVAEGRLDAHDTNIAALQEHDLNHDRVLATHTSQIADHETRIAEAESDIVDLDTKIEDEITDRTTADTNLSTRIADNAVRIANNTQSIRDNAESIDQLAQTLEENIEALTNAKADKDFAEDSGDKVVGKLESDTLSGSELFNLKETMVSPVDGTSSIERIKIISSDGTVVATRNNDGTIDLATNLDTDVNYFVTTEIISTTIAAETTLDMTKLTPTDKPDVEVQDIISDPEGTWGRVKSVNTQNDTCVVVTFKKHAQAVWGTIKGTLADQTDLQTALDNLAEDISDEAEARTSADDTLQDNIDAEAQARADADDTLQGNIDSVAGDLAQEIQDRQSADDTLQDNIDAEATARSNADNDLQDTIDNVASDLSDEVTARQIADTTLQDNIDGVASDLSDEVTARQDADTTLQDNIDAEETARQSADSDLQDAIDGVAGDLADEVTARGNADTTLQNNIDAEATTRANADNTKVDKVNSVNKVYGTDAQGNQTTYDKDSFGKVDTVNNVQADNNKNVQVDASNINLDDTAATPEDLQTIINNMITDLQTQIQTYAQNTSYTAVGTYTSQKFVTFTRPDGVVLMAKVVANFTSDNTELTAYESFEYDVEQGNLQLIGIPEQTAEIPVEVDAQESFDVLNEVDGEQDDYEGMGGTEEEILDIFDDILGE